MNDCLSDISAERACLSAICQYGKDAFFEVKDLLTRECFNPLNAIIFTCLENALAVDSNRKVDIPTIYSSAKEVGLAAELESEGKYVLALFNFGVELSNVRGFATKLRKLYEVKQLIGTLDQTHAELRKLTGQESIGEIAALAEKPIFDFTNRLIGGNQQVQQVGAGIDDYLEYLRNNRDNLAGVSIGFPKYEEAIGGLITGVHVVGARKKTGKSFFAINTALYASCFEKVPVLFLDTELRLEQGQYNRLLTRLSDGVEHDDIKYARFFDDEVKLRKVTKAKKILQAIPLDYVNITGKKVDEVISIIRRWLIQKVGYNSVGYLNKCLVVYDYLKPPTEASALKEVTEWQEIGYRMGYFHDLCSEYNFPILTFVQLNKENFAAASDRITWYCTSYSSFHKKTEEELADDGRQNGNRKLVVEDVRHAEGLDMGDYINFTLNGRLARLVELKTRNEVLREKDSSGNTND